MYIAIDIGGTKTNIATFKALAPSSLQSQDIVSTPKKYAELLSLVQSFIENNQNHSELKAIGISIAAKIRKDGKIGLQSNIKDYENKHISKDLTQKYDVPVFLKNDAACAALAEFTFGAGRGCQSLIHIIIGTGFGGSYLKKTSTSLVEIDMEPGHMIVDINGQKHHTHNLKGSLGSYISGKHLERQLAKPPEKLANDHPVWQSVADHLAVGLFNLTLLFDPDIITFSGSLIQKRAFLLERAQKASTLPGLVPLPPLEISTFSNPSLVGALAACS